MPISGERFHFFIDAVSALCYIVCMRTKKTAADILTEKHNQILPLAEKIEQANYTMARDAELRAFTYVTWNVPPSELAYYAAAMVLDGAAEPLSWF